MSPPTNRRPPARPQQGGRHRQGQPLARRAALGEVAAGAARTKTFLASRYKRIVKRRGKKRALVAVGNSILTIISLGHLASGLDQGGDN